MDRFAFSNTSTVPTNSEKDHFVDAVDNLILASILIIAILVTFLFSWKNLTRFLPESGASMLLGIAIGGLFALLNLFNLQREFTFSPEAFYFILLPPIIFDAGYNMKKRNFFMNMGTILLYAVIGTLISTFVIGYSLYALSAAGVIKSLDPKHPVESLLFGALISAIDPVATLSIMGSPEMRTHPLVYSLVFGESVLNDAVSIVLFRTFDGYVGKDTFGIADLFLMVLKFLGVSVGSVFVGALVGLLSAMFFKHLTHIKEHAYMEVSLVVLFAYVSYLVAEITQLSGVMSLFLTGVIMKHYSWYSLSPEAQTTTYHMFRTIAFVAETFIFVYLGINLSRALSLKWDLLLIFFAIVVCLIGRAAHIFPLSFLANRKRHEKVTIQMQTMLWAAGLRGAIAFALALNLTTPHAPQLVTTTLTIVLVSTLLMGSSTAPLLKILKLQQEEPEEGDAVTLAEAQSLLASEKKSLIPRKDPQDPLRPLVDHRMPSRRSRMHQRWQWLDEKVLKPLFGGQPREQFGIN